MPIKAPSLQTLRKLAKEKGCSLAIDSVSNIKYWVIDETETGVPKYLMCIWRTHTVTDTELRRGIKGFLDAL